MPFEITPLTESEVEVYDDVVWQAFTSVLDNNLTLCFYPGGYTDTVQAYMHDSTKQSLSDPSVSFFIVRDSDTKVVQAVARWHFQFSDKSIEEVLKEEEADRRKRADHEPVHGTNPIAINAFREAQAQAKREILAGKAHVRLGVLATLPAAQRRGAGAAALRWGLDKVDELGLPAYLEASMVGRPLYHKFGFKDVSILPFDARNHGLPYQAQHWCMLRDAIGRPESD